MPLTVTRTIDAPIETVFAWLADARNYSRAPGVLRVRDLSHGTPTAHGIGHRRQILAGGVLFTETITEYREPTHIAYDVNATRPPLPHRGGSIDLERQGNRTHVVWRINFAITTPLIGGALTRLGQTLLGVGFRLILHTAARETTRTSTM
ncbi:SRPBCC family protein [Nocardia sp. MDA0666]|uniref:SRPBCC family protein n=1 Tax=Nocardia sp. MDA0666 TaxID=2135448 RepID=UPI0013050180|nr:SRPBCC family protein [Nocardia sp. MDA0666]